MKAKAQHHTMLRLRFHSFWSIVFDFSIFVQAHVNSEMSEVTFRRGWIVCRDGGRDMGTLVLAVPNASALGG